VQNSPYWVVFLVLVSSFLHALWNAILKRQKNPELAVVSITLVSATSAVAWTVLAAPPIPKTSALLWGAAAGVFEAGYFVTLAKALARAPLGVAYTVARGGALLCIWPISVASLGERLTRTTLFGAILVAVGIALVGLRGGKKNVQHAQIRAGIAWAGVCALFITGYHLLYKFAMDASENSAVVVVTVAFIVAGALSVAWHGRAGMANVVRDARQSPWGIVLAGMLATASFVAFISALARGGAGAVMTLRNTSVLFAQVFAWMSGERSRPAQVAGVVAVVVGAVLTAWT